MSKVGLEEIGIPVEGRVGLLMRERDVIATSRQRGAKRFVLDTLAAAHNACEDGDTNYARLLLDLAAYVVRASLNDEAQYYFRRLINDARPINDEDWGSDRQQAAETRLWTALKASGCDMNQFCEGEDKAHTYDLLEAAIKLLDTDMRLELPAEERWTNLT